MEKNKKVRLKRNIENPVRLWDSNYNKTKFATMGEQE